MKTSAIFVILFSAVMTVAQTKSKATFPDAAQLNRLAARFAPTPLQVDTSALSAGDKQALPKLIEAAQLLNVVFMKQYWSGNLATYEKLKADKTPLSEARLRYYWINKGPWSNLEGNKAFMPGVPPRKPEGANFYPENMTKAEFESWVKTLPKDQQEQATGFFTVIRRDAAGKLTIVPYSQEYKDELTRGAALLREAAALTDNASLKDFLTKRAAAYESNDYYESDMAWMDLDAPLDITIGPYETYNDELFGYKAAFEAYVNLRDDAESKKLATFAAHLQEIENNLPEDPKYRNAKLGAAAPIRVVNQIIATGDGAHGVQTAAYNLPNDDRVVQQKGSKRVMLRNVQEAKFKSVLQPIAGHMIAADERKDVTFEPFFTHILAHELMHGLGPHQITVDSRETNPRLELKEVYSAIEEAKADITGLWALGYMMEHAQEMKLGDVLRSDATARRQLYTTFLASAFRTLRFGTTEAHGKGMALQFNYLVDKGGFVPNPNGTYSVDLDKISGAVSDLTGELLTIEATGDYAKAKDMLTRLGVIRPAVQRRLDVLKDIPVDIAPKFVTADQLAPDDFAPKMAGK
jgi:Peptidase family M49